MKNNVALQLFFLALNTANIIIDQSLHCNCVELNKEDCNVSSQWCIWNTTSSECQSYTFNCSNQTKETKCNIQSDLCKWNNGECVENYKVCSSFTIQSKCQNSSGCYWSKANICENFSNCSNYSVDNCPTQEWCSKYFGKCVDYVFVTCSQFKSMSTCSGFQSKSTYCVWDNNDKCTSFQQITDCSDLNNFNEEQCKQNDCVYENKVCRYPKCSDNTQTTCSAVRITGTSQYTLCLFTQDKCQDAKDVSTLTKDTCFLRTKRNYKWFNNQCVPCDNLIDSSFRFQFCFSVLLFLFIAV
ncbi:unnamed protein product [Paramecium sonneborni]|uniref:Mini antigen n=1 Tax=Paramecium sonneborni TaxID=65129 RepID=A0A8S1LUG5_9CILI|nr:unnamed protein product [Paramecium sonneborni]